MSDRYWIGGTATWDATTTSVWSTTSGGSGGASVPTSSDNVFFDQAGTYTVTVDANPAYCANFTVSASGYTFSTGVGYIRIAGNFTLVSGTVWNISAFYFTASSGTYTVTTNGTTLKNINSFGLSGSTAIWSMQDALTCTSISGIVGTLNTNGYNITAAGIQGGPTGTRAINMSTSQFTLASGGNAAFYFILKLTWSAGAKIIFTSNTGVDFAGRSLYYPPFVFTDAGLVSVYSGNNTFSNFSCTYVGAKTFEFAAGTTNTFVAFNLRGTSGNLYTITSTTTSPATIKKAGTWYMGANSLGATGSGNTGLTFTDGSGIDYLNVSNITGTAIPVQGNFLGLL